MLSFTNLGLISRVWDLIVKSVCCWDAGEGDRGEDDFIYRGETDSDFSVMSQSWSGQMVWPEEDEEDEEEESVPGGAQG